MHDPECSSCAGRDMITDQDAMIAEIGVAIILVMAGDTPGFVYTSGLSEVGKADMIFVGDYTEPARMYLKSFIGGQLDEGAEVPLGLLPLDHPMNAYGLPIWILDASDKLETHAFGTTDRLERIGSTEPPRLLQVVMCDKAGRFPWEPDYHWLDQQVTTPPVIGRG